MGERVNTDGPGDDPDEFWFKCDDCGGTGEVDLPYEEDGPSTATCPGCDGQGVIEGDASDAEPIDFGTGY